MCVHCTGITEKKVIEHKKICKIISKGPNYREPETINWNKSKQSMEVGSDNLIQGKLSVNKKDICRIFNTLKIKKKKRQNLKLEPYNLNLFLKQIEIHSLEALQKDICSNFY